MGYCIKSTLFAFLSLVHLSHYAAHAIIVEYNFPPHGAQQRSTNDKQDDETNFHEVDAYGDDYVDFGARTGENGAFYWHASYPVEDHNGALTRQTKADEDFENDYEDE